MSVPRLLPTLLALALLPPLASAAQPDSFRGTCQEEPVEAAGAGEGCAQRLVAAAGLPELTGAKGWALAALGGMVAVLFAFGLRSR